MAQAPVKINLTCIPDVSYLYIPIKSGSEKTNHEGTMKTNYRIINLHVFVPALSLFASGQRLFLSAYVPLTQYDDRSFVNDKGQFSFMPATSLGTVNPSFEMQAAFSLPGHIALGANIMAGGRDNSDEGYNDFSKYNYFEGFGGFYTSFKNIGIFEIYAGYGEGGEQHTFAYNEWDWWMAEAGSRMVLLI